MSALVARLLLCALFLMSGLAKVTGFGDTVAYVAAHGVPFPQLATVIALVVEIGGGVMVLIGYRARAAALALAVYSLAAALLFHTFWTAQGAERLNEFAHFWKNASIAGGFLMLFAFGAGRYSVDFSRQRATSSR